MPQRNEPNWESPTNDFVKSLRSDELGRLAQVDSQATFTQSLEAIQRSGRLLPSSENDRLLNKVVTLLKPVARAIVNLAAGDHKPSQTLWGSLFLVVDIVGTRADVLKNVLSEFQYVLKALPRAHDFTKALGESKSLRSAIYEAFKEHITVSTRAIQLFGRSPRLEVVLSKLRWFAEQKKTADTVMNLGRLVAKVKNEAGHLLREKSLSPKGSSATPPSSANSDPSHEKEKIKRRMDIFLAPRRNPSFVGRKERIEDILSHFTEKGTNRPASPKCVVLCGLGGVGKSQIALEYAHRSRAQYGACLWVTCDSSTKIAEDVAEIVPRLGMQAIDARQDVANLRDWLQTTDVEWLLIFDNAESISALEDLWPESGHGHVLLTTQDTRWSSPEYCTRFIRLECLSNQEGIELINQHFGRHARSLSNSDAISLVTESGGLPLALFQFASYIVEEGIEAAVFLEHYRTNTYFLRVDRWENSAATWYTHTLGTFLNLAFRELPPDSIKIMAAMALLDGDAIRESFLQDEEAEKFPALVPDFDHGMKPLCRYSLVSKTWDNHGPFYNVHRQVKRHTLNRLSEAELADASSWIITTLRRLIPRQSPFSGEVTNQSQNALHSIKHLLALKNALTTLKYKGPNIKVLASLYVDGAIDLWAQGLLEDSKALTTQAVQICNSSPLHASLASQIYSFHASILSESGFYEDGLAYFKRSRDVIQEHLTACGGAATAGDQALLANAWNNLGGVYYDLEDYREAERCNEMSLHIKTYLAKRGHPMSHLLCLSYLNMANTYTRQERHEEAVTCFLKAVESATSPTSAARRALAHHNLGLLRLEQGQTQEAKKLFWEACKLRQDALGDHRDTAISLHMVACCNHAEGGAQNLEEAMGLLQDALRIFETFQANVPQTYTARLFYKLSLVQNELGHGVDALESMNRSRELFSVATKGSDFPKSESELDRLINYLERLELYKTEKAYEVSFAPVNIERAGVQISNVSLKPWPVTIRGFSACRSEFSTDIQGFELDKFPSTLSAAQFKSLDLIESFYHAEAVEFLKKKYEAERVAIFDTTIRNAKNATFDPSAALKNQQTLGPAVGCHVDQSPRSVQRRVRHIFPDEADELLQLRVRVIKSVGLRGHTSPLALCDFRSTRPTDYVPCDLKTPVWNGESLQVHHNPAHEWWFAQDMAEDDVVLIKMFDSEAWKPHSSVAMCTPHCAFEWKDAPEGTKDRESMEIRAIVFS
ncbi:methyltransferase CmcJ [Paramyrothecium foliicola]|nr:methyltransferase CmcJ [Paramyrothecium foliicola]